MKAPQPPIDRQLLDAAIKGNTTLVQQLQQRGASLQATHKPDGRTVLHGAAEAGQLKVVRQLVNSKAAVNATTTKGRTPIHLAARRGHERIATTLLTWRASVSATDNDGCTPLHLAAARGHTGMIKVLVAAGADINAASTCGWTALHWAADSGQQAAASELLTLGAAVDSQDSQGRTALHLAAWKGHLPVMGVLLCGGAPINAVDSQGYTPLLTACSRGKELVMVELLRCGAQLDVRDSSGNTALHIACSSDHMGILSRLLQVPLVTAQINAANDSGDTPLYAAAKAGRHPVVQLLVKYGADTQVRTQGMTPLHAALEGSHVSCLEALLAAGADADALYGAGALGSVGVSIFEGTNPLQRAIQLCAMQAILLLATPTNLRRVCEGEPVGEDEEQQHVLQVLGYGPQDPAVIVLLLGHGARELLRDVDCPVAGWRLEQVVFRCSAVRATYGVVAATNLLQQVLREHAGPMLAMQLLRELHRQWVAAMPWLRNKWCITHRLQQLVIQPLQQQRQQQYGQDCGAASGDEGADNQQPVPAARPQIWRAAVAAADAGQWPLFLEHLEQLTGLDGFGDSCALYDVAVQQGRGVSGVVALCGALLEGWCAAQQQPAMADEVAQAMGDAVLAAVQAWEQQGTCTGGSNRC
jgi:ankyrin repeat protein